MSDAGVWLWGALFTCLGAVVGAVLHRIRSPKPFPVLARVAASFGGAALGTFGGSLVALHPALASPAWLRLGVILLFAIALSFALQNFILQALAEGRK